MRNFNGGGILADYEFGDPVGRTIRELPRGALFPMTSSLTDRERPSRQPMVPATEVAGEPVRIDSAHAPPSPTTHNNPPSIAIPVGTDEASQAEAALPADAVAQRLAYHAEQLEACLARRQEELDRRDAQWHAQWARYEQQLRAERLQLQEQRAALDEYRERLDQERRRIEQASGALAAAQLAFEQECRDERRRLDEKLRELQLREAAVAEREQQVAQREEASREALKRQKNREQDWELRRRWEEQQLAHRASQMQRLHQRLLARWCEAIEARGNPDTVPDEAKTAASSQETARLEWHLQQRLEKLADLEHQLVLQREELEQLRAELGQERRALQTARQLWEERQRSEHQRLQTYRARLETLRQQQEQLWQRRQKNLRQLALMAQAARNEALKLHGESLELRLAAEEILRRLAGHLSPGRQQVTARIRAMVADFFGRRHAELQKERRQLLMLRQELADLRRQLSEQRESLQHWLDHRHECLENEAARLLAARRQWEEENWKYLGESSPTAG
ncbi:MAG: hypothetical protein KatS3mg110_2532 [Pirellulaceae bacterium]|nr:MAG: hypothetical protein KatS3mg110_2532 [Pirellulaceae bacterium]